MVSNSIHFNSIPGNLNDTRLSRHLHDFDEENLEFGSFDSSLLHRRFWHSLFALSVGRHSRNVPDDWRRRQSRLQRKNAARRNVTIEFNEDEQKYVGGSNLIVNGAE